MDYKNLFSDEIESTVIGGLMIYSKCYYKALSQKVIPEDFYRTQNQEIFKTIIDMYRNNKQVDILTVAEKLKDNDILEKVGGVTYITEVSSSIPTTANYEQYIEELKKYSTKREFLKLSNEIQMNLSKTPEELQSLLSSFNQKKVESRKILPTSESQVNDFLKWITNNNEMYLNGLKPGLETGLTELDNKIGGFYPGDLITIFAFSGIGKTALACQIALNLMLKNKKILFFSLEMPPEQIYARIISNITGVPFKNIRNGNFNQTEYQKILDFTSKLVGKILISGTDELADIVTEIQISSIKNDVDAIFIDYISLVNISGNNKEEYQRVTECTRHLKKLAREIRKPIIILAQGKQTQAAKMNNKNLEVWQKVSVDDIAGGASIFRDSDTVLGLYRNIELDNEQVRNNLERENIDNIDYYSDNPDKNPNCMTLLIKKSRAAEKDIIPLDWKPKIYRLTDF